MYDNLKKRIILVSTVLAICFQANAQSLIDQDGPKSTKENSPYSRYGIGNLSNSKNTLLRGMGGAATAYNDVFSINSYNPATYSFLKSTAFEFAIEGRTNNVLMNNRTYTSGTATLSYLSIGVPISQFVGLNIGFIPLSNMYYNANDTVSSDALGDHILNYNGSGSIQYAYIGASGQYKNFSIGFNAGYAFGTLDYANSMIPLDHTASIRSAQLLKSDQVGGFYWKGGALYRAVLKENHFLNIGGAITLSQTLNVSRNSLNMAYASVGMEMVADTISDLKDIQGDLVMPAEYSFGVSYGKSMNWNIATDFVYTDWSSFHKMEEREGISDNAWKLSLGAEYTPNPDATTKQYLSLITYRIGGYYGKDYLNINSTNVEIIGGTVGASLPLKRNYTYFGRLHTSLDLGKRGTIKNGLAREFFVKFTVGVSLNDIWFRRPKYD